MQIKPVVFALAAAYPAFGAAQSRIGWPLLDPYAPNPAVLKRQIGEADYAANAAVGKVVVDTDRNEVPADGQSPVQVTVKLFDKNGAPLTQPAFVTVETDGGRILVNGAPTDELGPEKRDLDRVTPGTQIQVDQGTATFRLLAPMNPQDVRVRVSAGAAVAEGVIRFVPELREMIAAGLIEGVISLRRLNAAALAPARSNDGFEQELKRWSRQFNHGKANAAARTAFFLKGKILGQTLLTAAFDSDKETRSRLMRDIDPEQFYPVYGDSSVSGFDARSSDRLYVRIDHKKSYLLYGDFATGDGFSQRTGGGAVANVRQRMFGQYNRSATGVRGHYERGPALGNVFASYDNLKQVIEEYPANGTSGPFAVKNNTAIVNSEKVELLVRDRNQLGVVKRVTRLTRFEDYSFEPFSGRILFTRPIASVTEEGDPQSIRVTYEVEQGGEKFWTIGADGQLTLGPVTLGGSAVEDKNPLSPYKLYSANTVIALGQKTALVAEVARTTSTTYTADGKVYTTPSGQSGEVSEKASGNAARVELVHQGDVTRLNAFWRRTDTGFNNTAADLSGGRGEAGVKGSVQVADGVRLFGEALRTEDRTTAARRDAARAGVAFQLGERLTTDVSLQRVRETAGMPSTAGIAPNTAPLNMNQSPTGGFFGNGIPNTSIDPVTGATINTFAPLNSTAGVANVKALNATTVRVGAQYKVSDQFTLSGDVEKGIHNETQHRYGVGASYQVAERTRLYTRYERQSGLASIYSLNPADRSASWIAGIENTYMPGGALFSEYRLRDALSGQTANVRDMAQASGVRNTWNIAEGISATTSAEYLHVFNGPQQKALALSGGLDYAANPLWRGSTKLEFRRLFDNPALLGNQGQNQWLSTVAVARKLDRDWTLLARNYVLYTQNQDNAQAQPLGNTMQNRAQIGVAWRPVDNNRVNALAMYEYKLERDDAQAERANIRTDAHILSTHMDYHPSRPWWMTLRLAGKRQTDRLRTGQQDSYYAWLTGGRIVYDITENWDVGMLGMYQRDKNRQGQWAQGVEVGRLLGQNLWVSAGYNWAGFHSDLNEADYTARGPYLRLRFKFDEHLFSGRNPQINRTLPR
ncbi:Putative conserved repeat domain [Candidatus Glomeribacter gigasporarum BEG34]|uniref:Putative conserved repeat domain n=1 Tax=Candidatus Glomeribacter gigasporarum BEG34 TaxID=1070319 RepID=G2J9F5_9BURK|nr:Ig-like domain-containing protein [Candidatus Glomeribacter gigasporarum]CCD29402.1 Putative conserved repeat domain [Candidatus Glomeribacter gigasporarum BEG34]